jgi:hypothetical protein
MVHKQGIAVYLVPSDDLSERFNEHPVPATSPEFTGNPNKAYIEAVDGERFTIVVDLGADFEEKGSARLWIECFLDGAFISKHVIPYVVLKESAPPGSDLKGLYTYSRADLHINGR